MSLENDLKKAGYRSSTADDRKVINNNGNSFTKVGSQHYVTETGSHIYGDSNLKKKL